MNKLLLSLLALLFISCASRTPQTDTLVDDDDFKPSKSKISNVPFVEQDKNHCGPATLKMVLDYKGKTVPLEELTNQSFIPMKEGTFQTDMISTVRRQRMIPVKVTDLKSLLTEVKSGNPVIVFQNLGLESVPKWHYAVVTGYNLKGPDIILHTGPDEYERSDLRMFERNWSLAGNWGIVIVNPGELTMTGDDVAHMEGASGLEALGYLNEAEATYKKVLEKWPASLLALIGMGNIRFEEKNYEASVHYLLAATKLHPDSAMAWHNLAIAQDKRGAKSDARSSAKKALELVDQDNRVTYERSLKDLI